ncbi:MAG: ornithine carbamoyltransferase [Deltaproteobacteria bacterium RBG_16_58_17]|nr:MAG: ornithine carbamoyltransferase [Deltaproteobacteria bacterium RBG_16_58_17]OHE17269.1 MAG: ornithine carbamoyltransferase [Syntrophobacterales bacterium GWC2_56_13]OHE20690.1 MAG: ornithine carbamoyltransferase [Syntrophobacterales bacterium GWF2_56_9]
MKKDLLSEYDLERSDYKCIFENAQRLKRLLQEGKEYSPLKGKTLGMIFDKSSTRTRISFEVGMYQLGGVALFLSSRDTQLGRGEIIADTARIMSRYLNGIMIRTSSQTSVVEFARHATIPVINGLTDLLHPCQILGDLFTIIEKRGGYEGLKIAYVGDGNNIANSWINAAAKLPFHLDLACPDGYHPDAAILKRGMAEAPAGIVLNRDPEEAVRDADVVYTDVWVSMGQETERGERLKKFQGYQVNQALIDLAKKDVLVMHCLPAHRGEEITAEVIDGPRSVIIDEAENRLHVQKAVMEILMR